MILDHATGRTRVAVHTPRSTTATRIDRVQLDSGWLEITIGSQRVRVALPHVAGTSIPICAQMADPTDHDKSECDEVSIDNLKVRVLKEVTRAPGIRDTELAERLGITPFDAAFVLNALEEDGLLIGNVRGRE